MRADVRRAGCAFRTRAHTARTSDDGFQPVFGEWRWRAPCSSVGVVWFFEKDANLVVCEIRRAADDGSRYEFEIADAEGPKTQRFDSPTELISKYLAEQARLIKDGWRPRADLQVVD